MEPFPVVHLMNLKLDKIESLISKAVTQCTLQDLKDELTTIRSQLAHLTETLAKPHQCYEDDVTLIMLVLGTDRQWAVDLLKNYNNDFLRVLTEGSTSNQRIDAAKLFMQYRSTYRFD